MTEDEGVALYGERWASVYDEFYHAMPDEAACVSFLAELAGEGRALELGIGTGRIALPLARLGVAIEGVDASPSMLAKLRDKPGGDGIVVHQGDFARVALPGTYSLVFVVLNTICYVLEQDQQVACFENVAQHLEPGGLFVVEAFVPGWSHTVQVGDVGINGATLYVPERDSVTQRVTAQFIMFDRDGGARLYPDVKRYVWPSELDLMARIAGLRLRERWAGWRREAFTSGSAKHVSVYEPR